MRRARTRAGTLAAVYRICIDSWTVDEAIGEMSVFGYHKIWKNLKTYLKHLDLNKLKQQIISIKTEQVPTIE